MAMPIQSLWIGSQNREEPQAEQKPRRTFSLERNHVTLSPPWTVTAERGTSVDAKKWPECLRHCEQWQASGGGRSPATSKATDPQRHDPLCMPRSFLLTVTYPEASWLAARAKRQRRYILLRRCAKLSRASRS